jgi:hypothetical protein
MNKPLSSSRTNRVRGSLLRLGCRVTALGACLFVTAAAGAGQEETRGWLELGAEQRAYRERAGPLAPREEQPLEQLERSQELRLRGLQQQRQRQGREARDRARRAQLPAAPRPPRPGVQERDMERERLDRRIQRETFGAGRW